MSDPLAAYRSGSAEPWTVDLMCAMIRALRPSSVIETGTYLGLTTQKFIEATQSYAWEKIGHVYSVESDQARSDAAYARIRENDANATMIWGDALQFLQTFKGTADFIFLDDDHTAAHVREEIQAARKILRPGGVIVVHDVVGPFGLGALVKECGGLVLDLPRLHQAGGLGVIVRQ